MSVKIIETSRHVEEIYYPKPSRIIELTMDLLVDTQFIPIWMDNSYYSNLSVYARNNFNKELAYMSKNNYNEPQIIVNLGSLDDYPISQENYYESLVFKNKILRHVKILIKYYTIGNVERFRSPTICGGLISFFKPMREGLISINGEIKPDIEITMPIGWKIRGRKLRDGTIIKEGAAILGESDGEKPTKFTDLVPGSIIIKLGNRRRYSLFMPDLIEKKQNNSNYQERSIYTICYVAELSKFFYGLFLLPFFFISLGIATLIIILYKYLVPNNIISIGLTIGFSYLLSILGYCYFYFNCTKDGYYVTAENYFIYSMFISIISIILIFTTNILL